MDADATTTASNAPAGLTTAQAAELLSKYGPNAVAEERAHPLRALASKFWAPVPWMLEAAVVLEILLHRNIEAGVIAGLLVFNAASELRPRKPRPASPGVAAAPAHHPGSGTA